MGIPLQRLKKTVFINTWQGHYQEKLEEEMIAELGALCLWPGFAGLWSARISRRSVENGSLRGKPVR